MLETKRLRLDVWQNSDWLALRPIATDAEVMRHITLGVPWTDAQIQAFVDGQVKLYSERGFCRWKLIEKSTGQMIGFCGVGFWRENPQPEIGWLIARRRWRRGLATEAGQVALRDAFDRIQLDRIISVAARENTASTRIMKKLGLIFESEFENDGVSLVQYAIDRARYEAERSLR